MAEQPLAEYWDFVYIRNLMSNASHRPLHDFALAAEHVVVARIKHQLRAAPTLLVKTDCVVVQQLPKKHLHLLQELQDLKHPDGSQVYRVEEVKPLLTESHSFQSTLCLPSLNGGTSPMPRHPQRWADPCSLLARPSRTRAAIATNSAVSRRRRTSHPTPWRRTWQRPRASSQATFLPLPA